ncbi:hypothetical protein [Nocardia pseudovaccinii]|uniref:hypothetical protein n=1 Tax=Nocardia pseudovaccinii TaxID=189540 RepID=UPI0007A3AFAE|nr:hypothetical protein [Nocardia pseudovaccinii]
MDEEITRWRHLADEAQAGRLTLDPSVANDCFAACEKQIQVYEDCRTLLRRMDRVTGLGKFDCADALAKMLGEKAIGGDGDVDSALAEHIEVVKLIRDTIKVSVVRLTERDQQNAQGIAGIQIQ